MPLTDAAIRNLKPLPTDKAYADRDGLYLKVYASGAKKFMHRTRIGGTAKWKTVGTYPQMSLADARKTVATFSEEVNLSTETISSAYIEWQAHIRKTYKSPDQVIYRCNKYLEPYFGSQEVASVTRAGLSKKLTELAKTAPVQANRVLGDYKQFFAYCVARGWIENSPAQLLTKKVVGGKEKSRKRVLSEDELLDFICVFRTQRFQPATRLAMALLLVTGQRSGEVRGLRRAEVTPSVWTVPGKRTKTGVEQKVYTNRVLGFLTRLALKELGPAPFAGMEGQTLSRAVHRMGVTWTPHDLRRTMATWMSDNGVMPHIVEKCLNHKMGGVMEVYNRAEYAAEKKAAWRLWAKYLLQVRKKKPGAEAG